MMLQAVEDSDRMAWARTSHEMALLYNVNRGKAKSLTAEDFNPYRQADKRTAPPTIMTKATVAHFTRMTETMNAKTNGIK
jgi:hypothetical protein